MSLFSSPPPELFAATAAGTATTATAVAAIDSADHPPLRGRGLRWVLLDELKRHTQLSVARMAAILADHGFDLGPGRASKLISDALRWEVRRGRITRPARGLYRWADVTQATSRRITIRARTQTPRHPHSTHQPTLDRLRLALEHLSHPVGGRRRRGMSRVRSCDSA